MTPDTTALFAAAVSQARRGDFEGADRTLEALIAAAPADGRALAMQGSIRLELGRPEAALSSFDAALQAAPATSSMLVNRAIALAGLGRVEEALAGVDQAIAREPTLAVAHSNRASLLNRLDRNADALASAERAIALQPGLASAWAHRGAALYGVERYEDALASFEAALARAPPNERCARLTDIGMTLTAQQRYADALTALDSAIALSPDDPLAHYRRAHVRLVTRDFAAGWDDFEWRWRTPLFTDRASGRITHQIRPRLLVRPRPEDLGGHVLALAEQGVGDELMFASVLPDLVAVARRVTCVVDPRLVRLVSHAMPELEVLAGPELGGLDLERFDRVVALGSLPHAFRRAPDAFPGSPYLAPRPALVGAWRRRLGSGGAVRVGLSWRGGLGRTRAAARSIPLEMLRPLLERPDCEFVSLQYGDVAAELAAINGSLERPIVSFSPSELEDFEDQAALVAALDVVVTVQTALAHLTGAIGSRGFVMIPERPEWRYGTSGDTMPWYRSLTLCRQKPGEGWSPVIARVGAALGEVAASA